MNDELFDADTFALEHPDFRPRRDGIGSHESAVNEKDVWLTPPNIIEALGAFDLDPCAPVNRPWPTARRHFTINDNGLVQSWNGRVWCNPPYGTETVKWIARLAAHGDGVGLIFARTETATWTLHVWPRASGVLFLGGRLRFYHINGKQARANAGAPSALIAYGRENFVALQNSGLTGALVDLHR